MPPSTSATNTSCPGALHQASASSREMSRETANVSPARTMGSRMAHRASASAPVAARMRIGTGVPQDHRGGTGLLDNPGTGPHTRDGGTLLDAPLVPAPPGSRLRRLQAGWGAGPGAGAAGVAAPAGRRRRGPRRGRDHLPGDPAPVLRPAGRADQPDGGEPLGDGERADAAGPRALLRRPASAAAGARRVGV